MLVEADLYVRYLNKLTWPRAETKKCSHCMCIVAKDCLLTGYEQVCTRITQLFVFHHAENGQIHREMAVDFPIVITSMVDSLDLL